MGPVEDFGGAIKLELTQDNPQGSTLNVILYTPTSWAYDEYVINMYKMNESAKFVGDEYVKEITQEQFREVYASVSSSMTHLNLKRKSKPNAPNIKVSLHLETLPTIHV